jgi:transcriptional regulator with XRE-family HTH domain
MSQHEKLVKKALSKPGVKKAYNELKEEFDLLREIVEVRYRLGKTQEEIAKTMKTSTSVIGRLETGGGIDHSPKLITLRRYARALGCDLQIRLVPQKYKKQKINNPA